MDGYVGTTSLTRALLTAFVVTLVADLVWWYFAVGRIPGLDGWAIWIAFAAITVAVFLAGRVRVAPWKRGICIFIGSATGSAAAAGILYVLFLHADYY